MKKNDEQDIVVNTSHTRIRIICFALALILAVGAFSFGIVRLGHKDEGYYEITPTIKDDDAPLCKSGFSFYYYGQGSSSEIKAQLNAVTDLYGQTLLRSYKLLDSEKTYDGYVNLATLNASLGQAVTVSEELYAVLTDAFEKTQEERGFNLFAGALYGEWNVLLSLSEAFDYDPANNPYSAKRIQDIALATANGNFRMEIVDAASHTLRFHVPDAYMTFLRENEYSENVLDLNLLKDAYRLRMIRDALEKAGYTNGYLVTDSGLTLSLSGHTGGEYCVYGLNDEQVKQAASIAATPNSASSLMRSFPLTADELGYYTVMKGETVIRRCPAFITATGEHAGLLLSCSATNRNGDVVNACYQSLILYNLTEKEEIAAFAQSADDIIVCLYEDEEDTAVYANDTAAVKTGDNVILRSF